MSRHTMIIICAALIALVSILAEVLRYTFSRLHQRKVGAVAATVGNAFDWRLCLDTIAICTITAAVFLTFQPTRIIGSSMDNTLYEGQLVCTVRPKLEDDALLRRGEIVILQPEGEDKLVVKRIVGVPGDTVGIRNGNLYINGTCVQETYLNEPMVTTTQGRFWQIPKGSYFVLGDNRNVSYDSRHFGLVPKENIQSVAKVGVGLRGVTVLQPPKVLAEIACRPGV